MPRFTFVVLTLMLLGAAPAHASPERTISSLAQAGPVLSGDNGTVSWVTGRAQGPLTVMTATRGGPREAASLPQALRRVTVKSRLDHWLTMDGDPDGRISVHQLTREYSAQRGGSQRTAGQVLLAGPARGPLMRVSGCMDGEGYCLPRECIYGAGALSPFGTLSLEAAPGTGGGYLCFEQPPRLVSRGAVEWSQPVEPAIFARIATAGRFVAITETRGPLTAECGEQRVVVRDAPDGQTFVDSGGCATFDVTANGYLVRLVGGRLEWRSIDRRRHVVARRAAGPTLAAARDHALVASGAALSLIGRDGSRKLVARFNAAWKRVGDIDYDGTRVAWAERRCGAPRVVVTTPDRPRKDPPARCG